MKIREGAYYRTRGGRRIIGPMEHVNYRAEKWKFAAVGFNDGVPSWTDEGRWCEFDDSHDMDLISEVYVSDTPTADAPAPEAKTLRDELEEKAALAILSGYYANPNLGPSKDTWGDIWDVAKEFVEARKK
jgi:hypothetical protein